MIERDFLAYRGKPCFVLACSEKRDGETAGFRVKAEKKIVAAGFGLKRAAEKMTEAVPPLTFGLGFLF